MLRVAFKDLMARKRRLVTTSIAIVLGIAFLTGTQLLSTNLSNSIKGLVGDVYSGIDAVVRSPNAQQTPFGQPLRSPIPASVADEVAKVPGVRASQGVVESQGAQLVDSKGKVVGGGFGPPTITYNWIDDATLRLGTLTKGHAPTADDDIVIDFKSADRLGLHVGDDVTIASTVGGTETFHLVGLVGLGADGTESSGATPLLFTTATAQRLSKQPDQFNYVAVAADKGVSQEQLTRRLAKDVPHVQVLTGEAFTKESQQQISQFVDILGTFVGVFGYIALFVSIFIIYNTFSIIVAQRTRETALLRAVGARRRQVLGATMFEALLIGVIASVLGLIVGVLLAAGLLALMSNFFTLDSGVPAVSAGTIVLAFVIGIGITALSAIIPAWRSTKIPPIAALNEVSLDRADLSRARKAWGAIMVVVGLAALAFGLAGSNLPLVGFGAVLLLVSVAVILGPLIAAPVSRLLAAPFSVGGRITGRLAGQNAARNPKRTSATAAALTIGVTLVVVIAIVASSIKYTADTTIKSSINADYVVATASVTSFGAIPQGTADEVRKLPDVAMVSPVRFSFLTLLDAKARENAAGTTTTTLAGQTGPKSGEPAGDQTFALGIEPSTWFKTIDSGDLQGSPKDLTDGTMAVNKDYAEKRGWRLGDEIPVYFAATGRQSLRVAVIYEKSVGQGNIWMPMSTYERNALPAFNVDAQIYVTAKDGANLKQLRTQLDDIVKDSPTVQVQDLQEYIDAQTGPINTFLFIIYALLGLAIIIALIGIANTLSLSVLERTRELGLLRAVGMSRRQLRRTVRIEAAIIAIFGTLIGLVIGVLFSIALTAAISANNPGILTYHLPPVQLVVIVVVAALAGLLAAWLPSRRAARLDILAAVAAT
jgi:putative ABC transport system permease protein